MKFINSALFALAATAATSSAFVPVSPRSFGVRSLSSFELEAKKSIEDLSDDELKGKKVLV